jgi:2-hydroxychromene-2-carboxylate isomerase
METVNPHNPAALKAFWTDTTHHHPLFPEVLLALCRLAGFDSGEVAFSDATDDFDRDVYANRDYAVVARKASLP